MSFDPATIILKTDKPKSIVLFAAGRGGDPMRHLPFLTALGNDQNTVIAPHFRMLKSAVPEKAELDERIEILAAALAYNAPEGLPLVGIGHSIGAVALLAMAGGRGETLASDQFVSEAPIQFRRLALLAPPTGFFRRPDALHDVVTTIKVWVGAKDTITPPDQALFLQSALRGQVTVNVQIDEDAGHFTYMNELPPGIVDTHPDRSTFLGSLSEEIAKFIRQ